MHQHGVAFARVVMGFVADERKRQRLTVDEVARLGEFNRSTLARYLYEECDVPLGALYRMALALNLEASELVARAEAQLSHASGEDAAT